MSQSNDEKCKLAAVISGAIMAIIIAMTTGCGALGVQEFETFSGGPKWKFFPGIDVHAGINAIDTVDDARGVNPTKQEVKDSRKY